MNRQLQFTVICFWFTDTPGEVGHLLEGVDGDVWHVVGKDQESGTLRFPWLPGEVIEVGMVNSQPDWESLGVKVEGHEIPNRG